MDAVLIAFLKPCETIGVQEQRPFESERLPSCDPEAAERFEAEQQQRAETCRERQVAYAAALAELQSVLEALEGAQGESRMG